MAGVRDLRARADLALRLRLKSAQAMARAFRGRKGMLPAVILAQEQARRDALEAQGVDAFEMRRRAPGEMARGKRRQISPTNILFGCCALGEWFTIDDLARKIKGPGDSLRACRVNLYFELVKWRKLGLAEVGYGKVPAGAKGIAATVYGMPVRLVDCHMANLLQRLIRADPFVMIHQARVFTAYAVEGGVKWALWNALRKAHKRGVVDVTGFRYATAYKRAVSRLAGGNGWQGLSPGAVFPAGRKEPEKKPGDGIVNRDSKKGYRPGFKAARAPGVSAY